MPANLLGALNQAECLGLVTRYYRGGWTPGPHGTIHIRDFSGRVVRTVRPGFSLAALAQEVLGYLRDGGELCP